MLPTATLGLPAYCSPIDRAPEHRDRHVEEEGEYEGINLYSFNSSFGYQTKVAGQMNNPSIISLTNLGTAPPSPSGVRGANYIPSHTDAYLPRPLAE